MTDDVADVFILASFFVGGPFYINLIKCKNLNFIFQIMPDQNVKNSVVVKKEPLLVIPEVCIGDPSLTDSHGCESM